MTPASSFPISRVVRHDSLLVRLDALLPYPRNYWQLQEVSINSMLLVGTGDIHDRATDGPSETVPGIATDGCVAGLVECVSLDRESKLFRIFDNSTNVGVDGELSPEVAL